MCVKEFGKQYKDKQDFAEGAEDRGTGRMDFTVHIDRMPNNYAAYSNEYPMIIVTGQSEQEVRLLFFEAVEIWEEEERKDAEREAASVERERSAASAD